jgi:hypothetical protein
MRVEAEGNRKRNAACRKDGDGVSTRRWRHLQVRVEGIGVGGAVGRDGICRDAGGDAVTGDVVLIEEVIETEAKLGVVEACVAADGVVQEKIGEGEG